jgi:hypothetical protein
MGGAKFLKCRQMQSAAAHIGANDSSSIFVSYLLWLTRKMGYFQGSLVVLK